MREDFALLDNDVYSIRTEGDAFRVTKFTKDLNPVSFYQLREHANGSFSCNCPQSNRGACKHMDIMDAFSTYPERVDKGWFYCHENGDWFPPVEDKAITSVLPSGESSGGDPLSAGVGEVKLIADPVTPGVAELPPSPPGVMTFATPLKRRI
jgi:hypothetical protein